MIMSSITGDVLVSYGNQGLVYKSNVAEEWIITKKNLSMTSNFF